MSVTLENVQDRLQIAGKPASRATVYRYFRKLKIKAVGTRQKPQRYPAETITKLFDHLGLDGGGVTETGINSLTAIKRAAKRKGAK